MARYRVADSEPKAQAVVRLLTPEIVLIVAAVVVVLFGWVFPWLEPRLPWVDVTVGGAGAGG